MLPPENLFGRTKKLRFLRDHLERIRSVTKRSTIKVLDFGCGNGEAVCQYIVGNGVQYYGVDVHPPSLDRARSMIRSPAASFSHEVPGNERFDVIVYADVLEHLAHPEELLVDHRERLEDDGILVGSVPNGKGWFEIEKSMYRATGLDRMLPHLGRIKRKIFHQERKPYNRDSGHLQFFTKSTLSKLFVSTGFRIEDFQNWTVLASPILDRLCPSSVAEIDARLADRLPYWMVSGWLFTARKQLVDGVNKP